MRTIGGAWGKSSAAAKLDAIIGPSARIPAMREYQSTVERMVKDCTVPEQLPATQGHFPGHPVVPGAYLVALVEELLREDVPGVRLTSLRKIKFLKPLAPGNKAQLEYELCGGRLQFSMHAGDEKLLEGSASVA